MSEAGPGAGDTTVSRTGGPSAIGELRDKSDPLIFTRYLWRMIKETFYRAYHVHSPVPALNTYQLTDLRKYS